MRRAIAKSKIHLFLVISFWLLFALIMQPVAFAVGKVEHHQIRSQILADAGETAERELSLYLPEGYDTSKLAYPVLYLLHGATLDANNRTFLEGFRGNNYAPVHVIAGSLIESGKIKPLIVVLPNMTRAGNSRSTLYENYLVQELIPFIDAKYRTIPKREGRAIAGHSRGGGDALYIPLANPKVFNLVGSYTSGFYRTAPPGDLIKAHNQSLFPLQFWLYAGRNDTFNNVPPNLELVNILKEVGLPHVYVEDEGDHFNKVGEKLGESLEFFSKFFEGVRGNVVSVQPHGKLTTTWGEIKRSQ